MNKIRNLRKTVAGVLVAAMLVGGLVMPSGAFAQQLGAENCDTPTGDQYTGPEDCVEQQTGGGGGDPADPADPPVLERNVGPLPFTGFDVMAMTAVALAVAGLGLLLQRAVARQGE